MMKSCCNVTAKNKNSCCPKEKFANEKIVSNSNINFMDKDKAIITDLLRYPIDKISEVIFVQEVLNKLLDCTNGCLQKEQVHQLLVNISDISKNDQHLKTNRFGKECHNNFKTPFIINRGENYSNFVKESDLIGSKDHLKQFINESLLRKCSCCNDVHPLNPTEMNKSTSLYHTVSENDKSLSDINTTEELTLVSDSTSDVIIKDVATVDPNSLITPENVGYSRFAICDHFFNRGSPNKSYCEGNKKNTTSDCGVSYTCENIWPVPDITIVPARVESNFVPQTSISEDILNKLDSGDKKLTNDFKTQSKTNISPIICNRNSGLKETDVKRDDINFNSDTLKESERQQKCFVTVGIDDNGVMSIDFCPDKNSVLTSDAENNIDELNKDRVFSSIVTYVSSSICDNKKEEICDNSFVENAQDELVPGTSQLYEKDKECKEDNVSTETDLPSHVYKKFILTKSNCTNTEIRCVNEAIQTVCSTDHNFTSTRNLKLTYLIPIDIRNSTVTCAIVYIFSKLFRVPVSIFNQITFGRYRRIYAH